MYFHHEMPDGVWSSAHVPGAVTPAVSDLAARLCHLARPYLYEAMGRRLFLATLRELPATPAAHEQVALALAEAALHRALRLASDEALLGPAADATVSREAWERAQTTALATLKADALRELRGLIAGAPSQAWDA